MMQSLPAYKDIVLVGGGHSHALFIRQWAMHPLPGVRLTLVSESTLTPYSGMLPGLLAGHYTHEQVHIDLARVCSWAGVRFIEARMQSINLEKKRLRIDGRPDIEFDALSLDTGSTPDLSVPGAAEFTTPVKPVSALFDRWQKLRDNLDSQEKIRLAVVGSGAGGFEIIMALQQALGDSIMLHWVLRGQTCLNGRPAKVGEFALQAASDAGVNIHKGFDVTRVDSMSLHAANGSTLMVDEVLWCTAAAAPDWAAESGLQTDNRGFVATNAHLQSVSHPFVFATGDIGTQIITPSDKAGVFAVRQAPYLHQNLRRYFLKHSLKAYKPQKTFLSLMAVGRQSAIGNRGAITLQGDWLWKLKDHIDQKFMDQFRALPPMRSSAKLFAVPGVISGKSEDIEDMQCKGCGSKVAQSVLHAVLSRLEIHQRSDITSGLAQLDDAAVFESDSAAWVQSVDQISAIVDDPYVFGKIAAAHALSDVVTQTLDLHSAQAVVTLPRGGDDIVRRDLAQMLKGALDIFNADGCSLVGGHTAESTEALLGFVVNGKLSESSSVGSDAPLEEGDAIVLCKALGTGVIMAAHAAHKAHGSDVQAAIAQMQRSNRMSARVFSEHQAKRVTDVTGFGLLAHLHSLMGDGSAGALVNCDNLPLLNGALSLAQAGIKSSLYEANAHALRLYLGADQLPDAMKFLLCDPQTSGGLLGIVPVGHADALLENLQREGYPQAAVIASVSHTSNTVSEWNRYQ